MSIFDDVTSLTAGPATLLSIANISTPPTPLLQVLTLIIPFLLLSPALSAQPRDPVAGQEVLPRLQPTETGWIGFDDGTLATRLVLFDRQFVQQVQSLWTGLDPLAYAPHFASEQENGILLARADGVPTLYEVSLQDRLNLTPRWGAGADFDPAGVTAIPGHGVMLYSADGIAILDSSWTESTERQLELLAPPILLTRDTTVVVYRDFAGTHVAWLSSVSLRLLRELREVTSSVSPEVHEYRFGAKHAILLYFREEGRVSTIWLRSGERQTSPAPQSGRPFPLLVRVDGVLRASFLSAEYPRPTVATAYEPESTLSFEYPLSAPPIALLQQDSLILLLTPDTVALYNDRLEFLGTDPYSVGDDPLLYRTDIGETPYLLTSSKGSRLLSVGEPRATDIATYIPAILLAVGGLLLLAIAGILAVRYRRMRAIYRALVFGDGSGAVLIFSRRSRLLRFNAASRALLDLPESTPTGRHALTYFQAEGLEDVRAMVSEHLRSGLSIDRLVSINRGPEILSVRVRVRTMVGRYGSNRGFIVSLEDESETVERDRLLNWASVAHHIAHEMKTPLGTIRLASDRLRATLLGEGSDDATLGTLGRIIRESARLREIVEDLLTVARTDELVRNPVDIVLMIRSLADDMREYLPESATISVETELESYVLELDADQLAVAVRNLLDNARQAVGQRADGAIVCRLEKREGDNGIRLGIRDNGIGMSEETKGRLFQPFYTEKAGGSGIGTTIIKRVIEGHGGTITVESSIGEGALFLIELPGEIAPDGAS